MITSSKLGCEKYKMWSPVRVVRGAGIFLHDGKSCLLVHEKSSKMWGIPKGCKNSPTEDSQECSNRELREETGIENLPNHKQIGSYEILKYQIYEVEIERTNDLMPEPGEEVDDIKWVSFDDAIKSLKLNLLTRLILIRKTDTNRYRSFNSCRRSFLRKN